MFNLIIPPIIIVVAIALLIIFLARVVPKSEEEAREKQFKKRDLKIKKKATLNEFVDVDVSLSNVEKNSVEVAKKTKSEVVATSSNDNNIDKSEVKGEPIQQPMTGLKFRKEFRAKKENNNNFKAFVGKLNFFKKKTDESGVILPGINRMDGIKKATPSNFLQNNNEENLSKMDKILLGSRNTTKSKDSSNSNKEESELVRQISVDPRNSESYRRLGDFYVENDRLTDARECYKYVLRLNPKHRRAQLAMKRLDRILG